MDHQAICEELLRIAGKTEEIDLEDITSEIRFIVREIEKHLEDARDYD